MVRIGLEDAMRLYGFLAHNINNATQLILAEIALQGIPVRWGKIEEALGRIRMTLEAVIVQARVRAKKEAA